MNTLSDVAIDRYSAECTNISENFMMERFAPIQDVTRTHVSTAEAAFYLGRAPQTLRVWACYQKNDLLRPLRVGNRLAWPVKEIRRILCVEV